MERVSKRSEKGQALFLFVLTVPIVLMLLSLVLDAGWAYYTSKRAQGAADAAAMAAATDALQKVGAGGTISCSSAGCQSLGACPGSGALSTGCQYATANGFQNGSDGGRRTFQIAGGDSQNAPGVPNIPVKYWVQASAKHNLPQWFSGLVSSTGLTASAKATAAVREMKASASLYLLNRSSDCFVSALQIGLVCGQDFLSVGFNSIHTANGIYMASSNGSGLGLPAIAAGTIAIGNSSVSAPFTYLMGHGGIQNLLAGDNWTAGPKNGFTDVSLFTDPMAGKGQPPAPTGLTNYPVSGGTIIGTLLGAPKVLPPGNYYATLPILGTPTGAPIVITGNVVFSDGQGTPCSGFCNYVFYGGVVTAALSHVTFSPGRYVFAGAQPVAGGPGYGLSVGANSVVQDLTPLVSGEAAKNSDAGEIFIFTDRNYPGLVVPAPILSAGLSLPQARAGVMAGVNPILTLHGLNASSSALPSELKPYAPVLIWQDQANTTLKYTSNGTLDLSCGTPCSNILAVPGSQQMVLQGSQTGGHAGVNLYGTIYGPRGAYLTILGLLPGDTVAGPLQIITGSLLMSLDASLDLKALPDPPTRLVASLIQ